jgi:5-methylcytosine-specific restriction protein A
LKVNARGTFYRMPADVAEWWLAAERPAPSLSRRNPNWNVDELILALHLYVTQGQLDDRHPAVIDLSNLLNSLPIHTVRPDLDRFRNPNGVALKLANFAALDPEYAGVGMARGGKLDADVWDRYHNDPEKFARIAQALRAGAEQPMGFPVTPEEDETEREEGALLFRRHRFYERDRTLVDRKKRAAEVLACEVCGFSFESRYGELGRGFIECHHLRPLSEGVRPTRLADLILLCSNCHRMAHRRMPWPTMGELRQIISTSN